MEFVYFYLNSGILLNTIEILALVEIVDEIGLTNNIPSDVIKTKAKMAELAYDTWNSYHLYFKNSYF